MVCKHILATLFVLGVTSAQAPPGGYGAPPAANGAAADVQSTYQPQPPPEPEKNCTVEFVKNKTEVCVPRLDTKCEEVQVKVKAPVNEVKCIDVTSTNCEAEVTEEELELCVYVYEKKDKEAKAKVVDVKYTKRCDTTYVEVCEPKPRSAPSGYGNGNGAGEGGEEQQEEELECKEVPQEVCFNKPLVENEERTVNVRIPQPSKKCVKKKVKIPTVKCEQNTESRCFELVTLEETTQTVEKCTTNILPDPDCSKVTLNLPQQVCVEQKSGYGRIRRRF